jgi:hypothetical protein
MHTVNLADKSSIKWRSILTIIFGCTLISLCSCSANKRGAPTPENVAEQYVSALENKNKNSMLQLTDEESNLASAVSAKIGKIGGYKIQNKQIVYDKFTPNLWNAKIKGDYVDRQGLTKKLEDSISIQYQSKGEPKSYAGRWYLRLDK